MAALDAIVPRAQQDSIAVAAIRNTNHLGALAYYAEHIANSAWTCISLTISEALVHPLWRPQGDDRHQSHRHRRAVLTASAWCWTWRPVWSRWARSTIMPIAAPPIPLGWALDENGDPTTDASAAKKGAIAPFGGPKGYALGIAFEVLVASLAASAIGTDVKGTLDSVNVTNKGDLFIVIAPPHAEAAKALVTDYLDSIRAAAPRRSGTSRSGARRPRPQGAGAVGTARRLSRRRAVGRFAEACDGIAKRKNKS